MWLRRQIPKIACPVSPPECAYGWLEGSWSCLKFSDKVCTDGSGGLHSSDKELRRCGWSAVQLAEGKPVGEWSWVASPLEGAQQTVPRAELPAVIMVVENACGELEFRTDHQNTVTTVVSRGWAKAMRSTNSDFWERLKTGIDHCPWRVTFHWVNSHPTEALEVQTEIPEMVYRGNRRADKLARQAADTIELLPT